MWYESSNGKGDISATIVGLATAIVPVVIVVLSALDVRVSESELMAIIQVWGAVVSAVITAFGLSRKLYNKVLNKGIYE